MAPTHTPLVFTSAPEDEPDNLVELFSIDGKPYMVSSRPRTNLALQVVDDLMAYGAAVAEMVMLKRAIGDEAYDALKNFDGLKPDDLAGLARAVTRLTMGALEEAAPGNS